MIVGQTPPELGGIATFVGHMTEYDPPPGWTVSVFSTSKPRHTAGEYLGFWKGGLVPTVDNLFRSLGLLLQFVVRVWRERPSIVHIHTSHSMGFWWDSLFVMVARPVVPAIVLHIHGSRFQHFFTELPNLFRGLARWLLDRTDAVVALSSTAATFIRSEIGLDKVYIVPNGVSRSFFRPRSCSCRDAEARPLHLIFVGALVERKGIFDLLQAIAAIDEVHLHLDVVGDGQVLATQALVHQLGIEDRVTVIGPLRGDKLCAAYQSADVLVLPSYHEGMPLVVLEALASGLAVVTTPVGGIPDLLTDGQSAVLVPPGDVLALAGALTHLARDREQLEVLASAGQELARGYSFEDTMARIWQVYDSVLAKRNQPFRR